MLVTHFHATALACNITLFAKIFEVRPLYHNHLVSSNHHLGKKLKPTQISYQLFAYNGKFLSTMWTALIHCQNLMGERCNLTLWEQGISHPCITACCRGQLKGQIWEQDLQKRELLMVQLDLSMDTVFNCLKVHASNPPHLHWKGDTDGERLHLHKLIVLYN